MIIKELKWGEAELEKQGIENPRFEADLLLAFVLGLSRDQLYLERERILIANEVTGYRELVNRRTKGEPLQYILRRQEFMGLEFYVDDRVLIPRSDSEILVEKLLALGRETGQAHPKILDVCTGSGALAIAAAKYWPEARVVGTDLSTQALEVARLNAARIAVDVQWREGDFLATAKGEQWDWIITNPPYVSQVEYASCAPEIFCEPAMAFLGGEDGLDFYRRLAAEAPPLLAPQGKILMEIGWDQAGDVRVLFENIGFSVTVFQDLAGRDRVILAR